MRISFVTKIGMPGKRGVCFAIALMCQAYSQNGHSVELILPDRKISEVLRHENFWHYFQVKKDCFQIRRLKAFTLPQIYFIEKIMNHFREAIIGWTFSVNCLFYLLSSRPACVHLFTECKELLCLLRIFSKFYNPIIIYEVHVLPQNVYDQFLDSLGAPTTDIVVTTTLAVARYYENKVKLVKALPSGINLESFDYKTTKKKLRQELKIPLKKFVIGYGGRFVTDAMEKGIPELISSTLLLKKRRKDILLLCVGGPLEYVDKYRLLAKKNGLNFEEAIFLDHVPPDVLYKYMRIFDVCIMPFPYNLHFAHIMSPLKLFEYMASKNPIVATNLPSVREILTDGKTALLAEPGNSYDLAKKISSLFQNPRLQKNLSQQAYKLVSRNYTWRKRQAKIIDLTSN